MRRVRAIVWGLAAAAMVVAAAAYGRGRVAPFDADALLNEAVRIVHEDESGKAFQAWSAGKSDAELAVLKIMTENDLLTRLEKTLVADTMHYELALMAVGEIADGVAAIERSGRADMLYFADGDGGMIPVRYILANAYDKVLKYPDADSAYLRTTREIARDFGADSEEFVYWTCQCAESLQRKNKNYTAAINCLLPAKEAALHSEAVTDSTACNYLTSLAQMYKFSGNHGEAKRLALEALKRTGTDPRLIFRASNLLGELFWIEGEHEISQEYYAKAQSNATSLLEFFAAGINYANVMRQTGFGELAERTLTALGKYVGSDELTNEARFNYYEALGVLYTFTDPALSAENFRKAEEYIDFVGYPDLIRHILNAQVFPNEGNGFKIITALDRAEFIYNVLVGNEPRLLNELLLLKGNYLMDVRDYKNARRYLEAAYANILDYSPGDPQQLNILKRLAELEEIDGENIRREYYLFTRLDNAHLHGEKSPLYLDAVADMLNFSLQMGNRDNARYCFDIFSKNSPDSFDTRCFEFRLKLLDGNRHEAEEALNRLKADFPDRSADVDAMQQQYYLSQRSPKITGVAQQVFARYRADLIRRLLFMNTNERRNMDSELRKRRNEIVSAIGFAPGITDLALDYSLFSKGLLFHTQSETGRLLADIDSARIEIGVINGLKSELTRAMNSCDAELAATIQGQIDARERYLVDDYLDRTGFADRLERYSLEWLRANMAPDDVMVEFVEYAGSDSLSRIGGFIIGKSSPVRFMDFGEAKTIKTDNAGKRIWKKALSGIEQGSRIYFSTDGLLNVIPIEFADDGKGRPVCEKYDLHRVFHLSDIGPSRGIGDRVEAIGVADHNSPVGEARGLDDGYRGNWQNLAGVETELYRIAESLDGVCTCRRTFNDAATEQFVKSLSGQPVTTLHISTHGFYRGEKEIARAFSDPLDFDHNIAQRLLAGGRTSLSGLVMRNGNNSWKAETVTEDEDNILTAEEVETLSFPRLNLTVLSGCETGLGELSADGVWGLQRAFRIAGSRSLICSLCRVKDNGAADFMAEFYSQAVRGLSVHDAFYQARQELLARDPENKHVWSSFILIE